ncbi:glutamate 5-kinase [Moraxella nasibovis]|uniref:glutamate 5-kinase n=1 Tax=Moraxella nasibovis TaxID=2904120 RepID=UPI002410937B|nr:glutamate 5-kinase [Moraxella nasibovis]WFF39289.1 glutamate 5-kinase [Moraxella nasibovis]
MRSEITNEIKQAFDTDLKDAVKDFTIVRESVVDDDWASNGATVANTIITSGRGVFMGYSSHEIDGETIKRDDVKLIALQAETAEIKLNDKINGMAVINITKDPADVAWFVQLRGI